MLKKLLYTFFSLIVLTLFFSCSNSKDLLTKEEKQWLNDHDSISIALFPYYAPYQFINEKKQIDGILVDYLLLIESKIDYKFKRKLYSNWEEVISDAKNNKVDIVLEIQQTPLREEYLKFYGQFFESNYVIVTRKGENYGKKLENYRDKLVTVPKDYSIIEILNNTQSELNILTEIDDLTCLKKVSTGEYDAFIGIKAITNYLIKTENLKNLEVVSETEYKYAASIGVQRDKQILNQILSKVTAGITNSDKEVIFDNWLYQAVVPFYKKTKFWITLTGVILLLLLIILLLNRYLNYLILQKTKELSVAKERAEESNKLKTAFIHNISHEIRTPMNGIIGFSELLNDPEITPDTQKEYSKIIMDSSTQLISIIDDIIEISRLETNQVKVEQQETDIDKVLQTLFLDFQSKAISKNIAIRFNNTLTEDQNVILIDKLKINKILYNLIDNAIKFTKEGIVEIWSGVEDNKLMVRIKDTGIGIKEEDQELIFRNFSQSEKEVTKSYDGLGLGLSIAQKNAKLIGGYIEFTSMFSEGSTFTLILPYLPIINSTLQNVDTPDNNMSNVPLKQVVLIVEDGDVNFLFLKTILLKMNSYKFVIHRAENGKEAVDLCTKNEGIDLILMDIRMPIMDGYTATRKIKKLRPNIPIIAQTAYSTEEDIKKALNAGCDDFVSKPVDRKILKPMLTKYFSVFSK